MQNEHKVKVKSNPFANGRKIDLEELAYYTTKLDSFFVTNTIVLKDKRIAKPTILQYLGASEKADYAMYYKMTNDRLASKKILQLKKEDGQYWEELELNTKDPKKIFSLFRNYTVLNSFYDEQELTIEDFLNSLKVEEYYNHYTNKTKIMYDKLWREVKKPKFAQYYGSVTKVVDSIFTVEISNEKGQKMYDLNYSSLHPLKRHESLLAYDSETVKLERTYDYGDLISSKWFEDERVLFENNYFRFTRDEAPDVLRRRVVRIQSDSIKTYGNHAATFNEVQYQIDKKEIVSALKENAEGKIYFYSNYRDPINFDNFEIRLRSFFNNNGFFNDKVLSKDFEGSILLQIVTDHKGRLLTHEILGKNNESLTNLFRKFAVENLEEKARLRFRFKQINLDDKTARCTFILPINFEHRQFFKTFSRPSYNNWDWQWHWQWQQNLFWQQQQHQQFINNVPKF